MNEYRKALKCRLILLVICALVSVAIVVIGTLLAGQSEKVDGTFADGFVKGFPVGLFTGFIGVMIFFVVRCVRGLKDETELKKLYIAENDERKKMIRQSAMGKSFFFTVGFLVVALTVASFYNNVVTMTLMAVLIVHIFSGVMLKLYYFLKY